MTSRKLVGVVAALAGGILAVACGGSSASSTCDAECLAGTPKRSSSSTGSTGDAINGSPIEGQPVTPTGPTTNPPDAGGTTKPGPLCSALAECCASIKLSGQDSSTCEAAVAKSNENACSKAQEGYEMEGPCAPPATVTPPCTALATCCTQIQQAGYDPSTCKQAVSTADDAACTKALDNYKSFGDCP